MIALATTLETELAESVTMFVSAATMFVAADMAKLCDAHAAAVLAAIANRVTEIVR